MKSITVCAALLACSACFAARPAHPADRLAAYVERFNRADTNPAPAGIPNAQALAWMRANVPVFESADRELEEIYYFRWWTFRKHIRPTPAGYIVTEFLPDVPWAGKYNSIDCAAGHHIYEGRWLRTARYLDDYSAFWFHGGGEPRRYSFWAADAMYARYLVTLDRAQIVSLLPDLMANYEAWESDHRDPNGLFWQIDDRDGMEYSIGGSGYRPTLNSYMYGDARAIAAIARLAGREDLARQFDERAATLRRLTEQQLWNPAASFYETKPRGAETPFAGVREEIGFVPWYFNLPEPGHEAAWKQLTDSQGFQAPYGPATAERRHPRFRFTQDHECLWNGPSWPFATTQTLVALANLLNNYQQSYVSAKDYYALLKTYARSQHRKLSDGSVVPWIDENLDPDTGEWLARAILQAKYSPDKERGADYNHSGFADLVITGLAGLRPRADNVVEVNPLVTPGPQSYFRLSRIPYHNRELAIEYSAAGLRVFADGKLLASAKGLQKLLAPLPPPPPARAGWRKHPASPVIGGDLGTVFDIAVLKEQGKYRMWGSWRPKKSVALFESTDGVHWSQPVIVLGPNPASGWEDDINRPVVVKRDGTYRMWYTGQANGRSAIGYATSPDGVTWTRQSAAPVLAPVAAWEKVAVMCPHVLWDAQLRLFRMWYSAGEQYEPDAIGYATSPDGLHWTRLAANPIFRPAPALLWEHHKVTACQVLRHGGWHYMFYIGFRDVDHAQIGIARSPDGITGWQRLPANPILGPTEGGWDHDACYKPFAIFDGRRWLLWYNGRHAQKEQIGLAVHDGEDLGFSR